MKTFILAASLLAAALPALAQDRVSIAVGEPGFYGRLDIGGYPAPAVINTRPVIIESVPRYAGSPVYLRVPPEHRLHWARHCAEYNACGEQVYFVSDNWYNGVYAKRYHEEHRHDREHDHDRDHDYDRHDR